MKRIVLLALLAACGGGSKPAAAPEPAPAAQGGDQALAEQKFLEADALFNEGKYDEAASKFLEAYQAWSSPEFLYNVAQSYRMAGRCRDAIDYYERFAAEAEAAGEPLDPERQAKVDAFIADLKKC